MQQQLELRVRVPEAPGPTDIGLRQGQSPWPASRPGVPGSGWDSPHFPLAARPTLGTVPHCSLTQDSPAPQGAGPGGEQMRPLAPWLVRQGWWLVFAGRLNPPTGLSTGSGKRRLGLRTGPRDASLGGSCIHPTSGPSCAPVPDRTGGPREGGFGQVRVMVGKSRAELAWPDVWAPPPPRAGPAGRGGPLAATVPDFHRAGGRGPRRDPPPSCLQRHAPPLTTGKLLSVLNRSRVQTRIPGDTQRRGASCSA